MAKKLSTKAVLAILARILETDDANHYAILGLTSDATDDEIRKAYYELNLHLHTDKIKDLELSNQEEDAEIKGSYRCICLKLDPSKPAELTLQTAVNIAQTLTAAFKAAHLKVQNAYQAIENPLPAETPQYIAATNALNKAKGLTSDENISSIVMVRKINQGELNTAQRALSAATRTAAQQNVNSSDSDSVLLAGTDSTDANFPMHRFVDTASTALEHYDNVGFAAETVEKYTKVARTLINAGTKVSKSCTFTAQHAVVLANYCILQAQHYTKIAQDSYDKAITAAKLEAKAAKAKSSIKAFLNMAGEEVFTSNIGNTTNASTNNTTTETESVAIASSQDTPLNKAIPQRTKVIPSIPKASACDDVNSFTEQVLRYAERDRQRSTRQKTINKHINRQNIPNPNSTLNTVQMLWLHLAASTINAEGGFQLYVPILTIAPEDTKAPIVEGKRKENLKWQYALQFCGPEQGLLGVTQGRGLIWQHTLAQVRQQFPETLRLDASDSAAQESTPFETLRARLSYLYAIVYDDKLNIFKQLYDIWVKPLEDKIATSNIFRKDELKKVLDATHKIIHTHVNKHLTSFYDKPSENNLLENAEKAQQFKDDLCHELAALNTNAEVNTALTVLSKPRHNITLKVKAVVAKSVNTLVALTTGINLSHRYHSVKNAIDGNTASKALVTDGLAGVAHLESADARYQRLDKIASDAKDAENNKDETLSLDGGSQKADSDGEHTDSDTGSVNGDGSSGTGTGSPKIESDSEDNKSEDGTSSNSGSASSTSITTKQPPQVATSMLVSSNLKSSVVLNNTKQPTRTQVNVKLLHDGMNTALQANQQETLNDDEILFMYELHNTHAFSLYAGPMFEHKAMLDELDTFKPTCEKLISRIRAYRSGEQNATNKAEFIADLKHIAHLPNDPAFHIAYRNWYRPIQHKIGELDKEIDALRPKATTMVTRTNDIGEVQQVEIQDAAVNWEIKSIDNTKQKLTAVLSETNKATKIYYNTLPVTQKAENSTTRQTNAITYGQNIVALKPKFTEADQHRDPLAAFFNALCAAVTTVFTGLVGLASSSVRNALCFRTTTGVRIKEGCDNIQDQMIKPAATKLSAG